MNRSTRFDAKIGAPSISGGALWGLIAGDVLTLVVVTVIGFASHQTLGTAGMRMLATFLPSVAAWLAVAPFVGAYNRACAMDYRQVWRPVWAMIVAAPLAAVLRGFWLGAPVMPVFAAVMAAVSAAGILIWRVIFMILSARFSRQDQ